MLLEGETCKQLNYLHSGMYQRQTRGHPDRCFVRNLEGLHVFTDELVGSDCAV